MVVATLLLSILIWVFYHWSALNRQFPLANGMEFWPYLVLLPTLGLGISLLRFRRHTRWQWIGLGLATFIMVLNAAPVIHWFGVPSWRKSPEGLRVMAYNIWAYNTDYSAIQASIQQNNPDILFLTEVRRRAMKTLRDRLDYPYVARSPQGSNVFFSRYPLLSVTPDYPNVSDHGKTFSLVARIQTETDILTVVGFHPPIPLSKSSFAVRNQQYERLAPFLRGLPGRVILLGDFNMTPWSPYFSQFEQAANLSSATRGHGIAATWNFQAKMPLRLAKLPIDHIETRGFKSASAWAGKANGSDHRPVVAVLIR